MSPYLYIADNGPSNPVMFSGPRSIVFLWDAKLARHIWRPKDLATFETEAAAIIREETMWKILPGIEEGAAPVVDLTTIPIEDLRAELVRRAPTPNLTGDTTPLKSDAAYQAAVEAAASSPNSAPGPIGPIAATAATIKSAGSKPAAEKRSHKKK